MREATSFPSILKNVLKSKRNISVKIDRGKKTEIWKIGKRCDLIILLEKRFDPI